MTRDSELNTSPCIRCLTDKVKCYKKSRGPSCYRCYMKKGACSLAQGRRVKEDDDADPAANRHIEELLEGLGEKMDELTKVLKIGLINWEIVWSKGWRITTIIGKGKK